ncbi:TonB-dependent receptor [Dyadobacter sp. LHD-138]|uniref:TonB-dependent receptor n=1 Tax=Dyadobacter sp. LHD-138 TaxID=3071413 RepID=UPI0027E03DBF|nr:TonB-dependent receptor [Dyadobacter sp. LHD-138]MDQ6480131.1 TonB-dependent receptor [Dyadobacter sp. LHD-138]
MKLSVVLITLVACMQVSAAAISQKISLSVEKTPMEQVIKMIKKRSGYQFIYNDELLKRAKPVTMNISEGTLEQVLDECFANQPLTYTLVDKIIVVKPKMHESIKVKPKVEVLKQEIKGKVSDEKGEELPGVSIVVKGTQQGTTSNVDGTFRLEVEDGSPVLIFSFVGYLSKEIQVGAQTALEVMLQVDNKALDEVVVVGYGSVKKSDLTGSVSSVKGEQIQAQAIRNPIQALTGLSAGVQVLQNSGAPGSGLSVRVRGGNSIIGGNEPLYVVDGLPMALSVGSINPNDIQSMEILKDASATAIYGSRGANGVVMITTKKGSGKTRVDYSGYLGIQSVTKKIDMLNAKEFAQLANVRAANDKETPFFTDAEISAMGEGTDWQDQIFRSAAIQNHTLSVSGGNDKTNFNISGSYFDEKGIIINSYYKQYQLRSAIGHKISKNLNMGLNTIMVRRESNSLFSENSERGAGVLSGALISPPTVGVRDASGKYSNVRKYSFSPDIAENPVAMALERKNANINNSLLANLYVEWKFLNDFTFRTSGGIQYALARTDFFSPNIFQPTAKGSASITYLESQNIINENTLTYHKDLGKGHDISLLAGLMSEQNSSRDLSASATGFLTNTLENYSLESGSSPGIPNSSFNDYSLLSGLGRINYAYKGKYLLTGSVRADGSSRFGAANKWGYFPSAAIAWKLNEEAFWEDIRSVVGEFKLRSSWGVTGNTAVSPYQSLSVLSNVTAVFDQNLYVGFAPGFLQPNPRLKWETTTQFDAGLDLSLFKNRLQLTVDYYRKNTRDLLNSVRVSPSTGYSAMVKNLGNVQNNGYEVALNAYLFEGPFKWNLGVNFSRNKNKVISLNGGADIFGEVLGNTLPAMSLVREGYPIGVFFGYVENGYNEAGQIVYKDLDNNGAINALDRTIIGDPNPNFIVGLNSTMRYKNFNLNFVVTAIQGQDILNYNLSNIGDGFSFGINQISDVLNNYWTPENTNARYPKISKTTRYLGSDRFIEDASFLRMKNVQLSYTFDGLRNGLFSGTEIYVAAQNLFTISNYTFYSPEVNTRGAGISKGIDQFGYPDAKTFMVGLKLKF